MIAVTAHAMTGERDRLLKAGMDDYVTKPIEEHVLQQVLMHWNPNTDENSLGKLDISTQVGDSQSTLSRVMPTNIEASIIDWSA